MTADIEAPALLPMTTFLIANDVPKEHRTAACAAFGLWLEQFGEGNAPLALLHLAEALKREQDANAELAAKVERVRRIAEADRLGLLTYGIRREAIFDALSVTEAAVEGWFRETPESLRLLAVERAEVAKGEAEHARRESGGVV